MRVLSEEEKKARKREYVLGMYYWYKEHGICVRCKQEQAMPGYVRCPDCIYKDGEKAHQNPKKHDDRYKEKQNKRLRERYHECKKLGLCTRCAKKQAYKGGRFCYECMLKAKRYARQRKQKKSGISGEMHQYWKEQGLCYFCGKPVVEGKKTCEEHYRKCAMSAANMRAKRKVKIDAAAPGTHIGLGVYKNETKKQLAATGKGNADTGSQSKQPDE